MSIDSGADRYLQGIFEPVQDERIDHDLVVTGEIPAALTGTYMRNGGNAAFSPLGRYHLFDGDGMIHAVTLADGSATYRNRFVESRALMVERRAGRALYGGLSQFTMPSDDVVAEGGFYKNTANTHVVRHADRVLALMEGAGPTELSPALDTLGEYDFDGRLQGPMTAHPKFDPTTGELSFFGYSPFPPHLRYHVADAAGVLTRSIDVPLERPVMMHDFVMTERFVVFFDLPAIFDFEGMISGGTSVRWEPTMGARIGVMPRDASTADEAVWIEVEPFYIFHFMNGWDDGDTVVVDGCRSPEMPISFGDAPPPPRAARAALHRWTIDLTAGTVTTTQLDDRFADFPRVAPSVEGRPYRFGYVGHAGTSDVAGITQFDGVTVWDFERDDSISYRYGDGVSAGEAVFAPDPAGIAENDGWLLNFVSQLDDRSTKLVILDARDVEAGPVASIAIPRRVPFGFHGSWMPDLLP